MNKNLIIILLILTVACNSCKTVDNCKENNELGNLGSIINSNLDEHSPSVLVLPEEVKANHANIDTNDYLYYTTTRYDQGTNEAISRALLHDLNSGVERITDPSFPLNDTNAFRHAGLPVFYYNNATGKLELYFAALPKKGRLSRDIFYSELDMASNTWSYPVSLPVNSQHYESHPAISPDGKILMFSSDRPNSIGDIDLWYAARDGENLWSEPINAGAGVNTKATDYTPYFLPNQSLLFASNGHNKDRTDFDIIVAEYDSTSKTWINPSAYSYPINSEADETGPAIYNNIIYLASNRRGGCGGKDIYSFHLCGPVLLTGKISNADPKIALDGDIFLKDNNDGILSHAAVAADGTFNLGAVQPYSSYTIDYKNRCYPNRKNIYNFSTPCSDSTTVVVIVDMKIPEKHAELELTEVEIPYFVTGYYKPNTETNLEALRLKFSYNLVGTDNKTKYIENPGHNYDEFTSQVEAGLNDVVRYIANMIANLTNLCEAKQNGVLQINVQGWADPRQISPNAEYSDADIDDNKFNLHLKKGTRMDNNILSSLRAYYTAKYFEEELAKIYPAEELERMIAWSIEGMGVDATENIDLELKRRVKISLNYIEEKQ